MFRAVATLLLSAALVTAQDTVEFRFSVREATALKVEQTFEIRCMDKEKLGLKVLEAPLLRGSWQVKDEWTDACISAMDGRPIKVKRTWTASKTASNTKGKSQSQMEGTVMVLEEKDKAGSLAATVEKGTPWRSTVDVICKGPIDTVLILLPPAPVAVGGTFKIPVATVDKFLRSMCAIAPSADRGSLTDLGKVTEMLTAEKESIRSVEVTGKLASVEKEEALLEYDGKALTGLGTTEIKGTVRWNIASGKPIRLEWAIKRVVLRNDDANADGYTEDITLTRTWK